MRIEGIDQYLDNVKATLDRLDRDDLTKFADALTKAYEDGKQIFVFGNGGSGSTASHFCGDFLKGVSYGLDKRFRFLCLNDNIPALLAIANDLSYDDVFVEQLKNHLRDGDLVIGISGSGNSMNVVKALQYAKENGAVTVAMCGYDGGKIIGMADIHIHAEITNMEVTEDVHLVVIHCLKTLMKEKLKNRQISC
ncbi:MAG: SIS domain-containing protein [Methanomassiliicoccales archaeon]|jgi:D-sedoheptulose 7-phosphate isomerase